MSGRPTLTVLGVAAAITAALMTMGMRPGAEEAGADPSSHMLGARAAAAIAYARDLPSTPSSMLLDAPDRAFNAAPSAVEADLIALKAALAVRQAQIAAAAAPELKGRGFDLSFAINQIREKRRAEIVLAGQAVEHVVAGLRAQASHACGELDRRIEALRALRRDIAAIKPDRDIDALEDFLARFADAPITTTDVLGEAPDDRQGVARSLAEALSAATRCPLAPPDLAFEVVIERGLPNRLMISLGALSDPAQRTTLESRLRAVSFARAGNLRDASGLNQPVRLRFQNQSLQPLP